MGYQALLFCPDEKTARAVTQVLSELDFTVDPCTEPFGAVKKLMAQHFDAVVVDCDNEQNATLLFKSARNSASNQSSLAVAVVEGQAGVAKAFRIGANLVLTKPINIEQAKGTLRVARGLLRKGGDPTKSVPAPVTAPAPSAPVPPAPRPTLQSARPVAPAKPAFTGIPKAPDAAPATAMASAQTMNAAGAEHSGEIAAAPKTQQPSLKPAAAGPAPKKSYPWQPTKPGAEPMASALRKAAEAAGINESTPAKANEAPEFKIAPERPAVIPTALAHGAASAPAPAKEKVPEALPLITPASQSKAPVIEPPAAKAIAQSEEATAPEPPSFSMGAPAYEEEEPASNKKALLIVAAVVVLASLAGYLGWHNMSGKSGSATPTPAATSASTPSGTPASPSESKGSETSAAFAEPTGSAAPEAHSAEPTPAPVSKPSPASRAAAHEAAPTKKEEIALDKYSAQPAAPAMVVKNEQTRSAAKSAQQESDQPLAPSAIGMGGAADTKALAAISNAPVSVPKASPDVVKVSQGVSEGLVLKRVPPRYPPQAIQMRKEGSVQLQATVTKEGSISNVKVLGGDAMLAHAAVEAVKQWKYKPYYLNGDPVDIQTQIVVNFKLPQ